VNQKKELTEQLNENNELSAEVMREQLVEHLNFIAENRRNAPNKAIEAANYSLVLARSLNDKHSECRLHNYIGGISLQKGNLNLGKQHLFDALSIYSKYLEDLDLLARIKMSIGSYYFDIGDFENSLLYFFQALNYNSKTLKTALYNNIASVYLKLNQYEEAFEYLFEGLSISEELNDDDRRIFFLYNIGSAYHYRKEYLNAINYYHQTAEAIEKINGYQYMKCLCLIQIAIVNSDLKIYESSLKYFDKALDVSVKHNLFREEVKILRHIGETKLLLEDVSAFIEFHNKSITKSKSHDLPQEILKSYENLKAYYEKQYAFESAYRYAIKVIELQKNVFTKERDDKIANIADEKKREVDLLEQKNQHIKSQNKTLERTNQMLEEFAYVVAHDLREPLRSIISFTGLLEKRNKERFDSESMVYMSFIVKSGKHMNALLSDLLEYTTIDKKEIERHAVNTDEVVSDINFLLSASIEQTNAVINFDSLPVINANETHIKQLFQQLIHNAMKFTRKGISPIINITSIEKGKHIEFSVQDNGIGIAPVYLDKIFKIFNRLDKKNYTGTGIGLAICQKIAQMYGGNIWVESVEGEGSTFYFTVEK
jgi:signal transduction histidine kinase